MHDWNAVLFRYCDGGSYSGMNLSVTIQQGYQLHFKGGFIREAFMDALLREHGLASASEVVLSGCSAGGLATFLHADWWRLSLPASAFLVAVPDSGFFVDWSKTTAGNMTLAFGPMMRRIFHHFNASSGVDADCLASRAASGGDPADCYLPQHAVPFVTTPLWISQSLYDIWQLAHVLGSADGALVQDFASAMLQGMAGSGLNGTGSSNGGFVDSCDHHCYKWADMSVNGLRRIDAFGLWYETQLSAWRGTPSTPSPRNRTLWQLHSRPCKDCCGATGAKY